MLKRTNLKRMMKKYTGCLFIGILLLAAYLSPSSAELLNAVSNPGFESGTSPWTFYTNGKGTFSNDASGVGSAHAGHVTISQQATNVQLYQAGLTLEPNTKYKLSFKAYSNTGHDLSVSLQKHGSPYTNYGLSNKVFNLGTSWSEHSVEFTTSGFSAAVNDGRLMFWMAPYDAAADQYYFDDIVLTKVTSSTPAPSSSTSLLPNSGFESGTPPWTFYTNGKGTFSNDASGSGSPHAGHITISQQGTNVQLFQSGLALEPNTKYKLSFKAYSNTGHDLSVSLQKHGSPYTNYGLSNRVFNLGTSWSEHSVEFTTSGFSTAVKDGRLMFWMAPYDTSSDQYYFDDVMLTKVTSSTTPVPSSSPSFPPNSGFESGTPPWTFYTNGKGTFSNDASGAGSAHAGHITISQQGTNVQLFQSGLALEPNTKYKLSFKAYSNTSHDLSVSLQKHGSPYTNYGLSNRVFNLGTSWSTHSVEFTTSGFSTAVKDGRLMFWMAPYDASADQYYFDDVVITKVSSSASPPPTPTPTPPITTVQPPKITTQPASKTVTAGQKATFSVGATGTSPLKYQWQKNGVNIAGATGESYTTPVTTSANNGERFRAVVSNTYGKVTSNEAILTVSSTPTTPSSKQLLLLDVTHTHDTKTTYVTLARKDVSGKTVTKSGQGFAKFNFPSGFPTGSLVSPTNFAGGTLYQRLQVLSKPTSNTVQYQVCVFQDQIISSKHACSSSSKLTFTRTGTYYASQSMTSLYQYNVIDWKRELLVAMTVVKDKNGVPVDNNYFAGKWFGSSNLALYYPMKVRYTAIIVPPGGGAPVWP